MKRFLLLLLLSATATWAQNAVVSSSVFGGGEGVNGQVNAVAVQSDGKIIIGGHFTSVNGQPRNNIARINSDGTLDETFAQSFEAGVNGPVNALAVEPGGGIIVGGTFTQAGGKQRMNLARYNGDGSFDGNFGGHAPAYPGTNGPVLALAIQTDGKIVVGGNFNTVFGQPRRSLARLNSDSTLDGPLMAQNALTGQVNALGATNNGSAVAGGQFNMVNQNARNLLQLASPE